MNQGVPKAARDALARQTPADQHPSADLLNGYAEQSLTLGERGRVANHLAACADCREIVFLASAAAGTPAVPVIAAPVRPWAWWKWVIPAAAALAMVSSVLVYRQNKLYPLPVPATQIANNQPVPAASPEPAKPEQAGPPPASIAAPPPSESRLEAKLMPPTPQGPMAPTVHGPTPGGGHSLASARGGATTGFSNPSITFAGGTSAGARATPGGLAASSATNTVSHQTPAGLPPEAVSATASPLGAAPEKQSLDSAELKVSPGLSGKSNYVGGRDAFPAQAGAVRALNVRAFWRVTADGHLEREKPGAGWIQVLADQPVTFHVVSIVANNVWAGGNNGALFHSVDGGEHWVPVVLTADSQVETGTVVSIRFETVAEGTVDIESGGVWHTSDGGQSWTKQ